jgi:hypothetical protein
MDYERNVAVVLTRLVVSSALRSMIRVARVIGFERCTGTRRVTSEEDGGDILAPLRGLSGGRARFDGGVLKYKTRLKFRLKEG